MTKLTDTSNLDFDNIKDSIKTYLQAQSEFTDYDFEGSGISTLVDLLAHNTQYNAMLAHLNMNETFIDSAQNRQTLVSLAQSIGYVPKSDTASQIVFDAYVVGTDISPDSITVSRGDTFSGRINSKSYVFTVLDPVSGKKNRDTILETSNGVEYYYQLNGIVGYQGKLINEKYRVDALKQRNYIEIYSDKIDISTLRVRVYDTSTSTSYTEFKQYDFVDITTTTNAYFVRQNTFGNYEIYFGDDYIGKSLQPSNIIEVEFIDTDGPDGNNVKELGLDTDIGGLTNITLTVTQNSSGGFNEESIESIRYNAPVSYAVQNRAVTAADYKSLIISEFPQLNDVAIWGGEDATPPVYGKVFISPALITGQLATESLKKAIKTFTGPKHVASILPEIIDAEYTYLDVESELKFNDNVSSFSLKEIESLVKDTILNYGTDTLNTFSGIYRQSNITTLIDQTDPGITSSIIRTSMYKNITPNPMIAEKYVINFPVQLYQTATTESVCESSQFLLNNRVVQIFDEPASVNDVLRRLYVFDVSTQSKLEEYTNIGTVDPVAGTVTIENVIFDNANTIKIYARPNTYDILPKYNQLLALQSGDIRVTASEDTVAKYSIKGVTSFNPASRH